MRQALHLKFNQHLAMTPQLQQAIRLLQLSSFELEQEIQNMLELNPLLEPVTPETETGSGSESEFESFTEYGLYKTASLYPLHNPDKPLYQQNQQNQQKNPEPTLHQYLLWQLELLTLSEKEKLIAIALIDAISEEGYLIQPFSEIKDSILQEQNEITEPEIEKVLSIIQQFDPVGVGARNLGECLNIQLQALMDKNKSDKIIQNLTLINKAKELLNYLDVLAKRDYIQLCHQLDLDQTNLKLVIDLITSLNPRPGNNISSRESEKECEYIIPDIQVMKKNEQWLVKLTRDIIPNIRVNADYASFLKKSLKKNLHKNREKSREMSKEKNRGDPMLLQEQLKEAKWFIKGIETRQETLLKVSEYIIKHQRAFLEKGEEYLKPLTLQQVASKVGLHESTVSRITSQKYALTPRGVFELKSFFSNALTAKNNKKRVELPYHNQSEQSARSIRALIKKFISNESTHKPLSDQKLKTLLLEQGIQVARRTIAKYREALQIPASSLRKDSRNWKNSLL